MAQTTQSGRWHDPAVWDIGRVPTIGDSATLNHLIYADANVSVGDGSDTALVLNKPLVCLGHLSVVGKIKGVGAEGGLVFINDGRWIMYASNGIDIPPISQQALSDLWDVTFGTPLPQGLIIPVSGRIDGEFYFSPNYHDIITPLKEQIKAMDGVYAATHDPTDPANSIKVLLSAVTSAGFANANTLLSTLSAIEGFESAVSDFTTLNINLTFLAPLPLTAFLWMRQVLGNIVLSATETDTTLIFNLKGSLDPTELVRIISLATNTISTIEPVLQRLGYTKTLSFQIV
jgi:hypothetical protein